ncbi:MAG: SpoIIIAH-like family protein [Oscillospiraceae bacterium]|jgi:stage III sporulation protein AH|nr:SpoIIIAH-like family protein [Oscillospiraceae bacterium]
MKLFKRNAIILTVIMFVCAAVYLNWAYNRPGTDDALETADSGSESSAETDSLYYEEEDPVYSGEPEAALPVNDYFADVRLARQQARDSAVTILRENSESSAASQDIRDDSLKTISVMAQYSLDEAEIESMIRAKGFSECVVFLKDDSVVVTVPAPIEGLSTGAVSRITDIILRETGLGYEQIKIVEVK